MTEAMTALRMARGGLPFFKHLRHESCARLLPANGLPALTYNWLPAAQPGRCCLQITAVAAFKGTAAQQAAALAELHGPMLALIAAFEKSLPSALVLDKTAHADGWKLEQVLNPLPVPGLGLRCQLMLYIEGEEALCGNL